MKDYIARAVSADGFVRIFTARTTNLSREAARIHACSAPAAAALGRTLTATAMMGAMMKDEGGTLTVRLSGGGPIGVIYAVSDASSKVRGYCTNPQADAPDRADGHLNVGAVVGCKGELSVIRDYGLKEPYTGTSPLVTGEIAEDFTGYFAHSEQTPSAVGLGVLIDRDLSVITAGGFIVQLMPGATEEHIRDVEESLARFGSVTEALASGKTPEDMAEALLGEHTVLFYDNIETGYDCPCTKERMARALYSLKVSDLEEMIEQDGKAELSCRFCKKSHVFCKEELLRLLEQKKTQG